MTLLSTETNLDLALNTPNRTSGGPLYCVHTEIKNSLSAHRQMSVRERLSAQRITHSTRAGHDTFAVLIKTKLPVRMKRGHPHHHHRNRSLQSYFALKAFERVGGGADCGMLPPPESLRDASNRRL